MTAVPQMQYHCKHSTDMLATSRDPRAFGAMKRKLRQQVRNRSILIYNNSHRAA